MSLHGAPAQQSLSITTRTQHTADASDASTDEVLHSQQDSEAFQNEESEHSKRPRVHFNSTASQYSYALAAASPPHTQVIGPNNPAGVHTCTTHVCQYVPHVCTAVGNPTRNSYRLLRRQPRPPINETWFSSGYMAATRFHHHPAVDIEQRYAQACAKFDPPKKPGLPENSKLLCLKIGG